MIPVNQRHKKKVEYPETKDIYSVFSDTSGVTSCADNPMVLSSPLKPCFQSELPWRCVRSFQHGNCIFEKAIDFLLSWED